MSDPSAHDPFLRVLAYAHPLWMSAGIAWAAGALRSGLAMRRARRRGGFDPNARARHLRRAKIAVLWIAVGFVSGPLSMSLLRGRELFATAHSTAALAAFGLFVVAGALGWRLEQGAPASRDTHAFLAVLALLAAALCAATGFVLLP